MIKIIIYIIAVLWFGIGAFILRKTLKREKEFVDPPSNWFSFYPYVILKKIGPNAIFYFHIFIGISIICCSIYFFIYMVTY
jgi:hypothetical protein